MQVVLDRRQVNVLTGAVLMIAASVRYAGAIPTKLTIVHDCAAKMQAKLGQQPCNEGQFELTRDETIECISMLNALVEALDKRPALLGVTTQEELEGCNESLLELRDTLQFGMLAQQPTAASA